MDPNLRASDADRERAAATLQRHLAAGRLTLDEFSERSARAYAARTAGELAALSVDLPRDEQPADTAPPRGALRGTRGWALVAVTVAALAAAALVGGFTEMAVAAGSMMDGGCR